MYSLSLREEVSDAAVEASFDRSVARVDHATAGHVPKRQAEQEVVRAATDFEAFYATRTPPANDTLTAKALQVMSSDCKGVTMRPEALRDATRKAAEAEKADARRGDPMAERKKRRSDKRMAVVTAVWEQEPQKRTAKDVLHRLRRDPRGRRRRPRPDKAPKPQNKRVAASVAMSLAEGVAAMFDEAQRRNPDGERRNIVLVDGDEKQIERVEAEADKRSMSITLVLDLIHVIHCNRSRPRQRRCASRSIPHCVGSIVAGGVVGTFHSARGGAHGRGVARSAGCRAHCSTGDGGYRLEGATREA
jgi:hypothetical protein